MWFTLLIVISAVALAFFAFIAQGKKRWSSFISITLIVLIIAGLSLFYERKYQQKIKNFKTISYHFNALKDLSDFEADKYQATVVVEDSKLTKKQLQTVLVQATETILKEKRDASIIWLAVFDSDSASFTQLDETNPSLLAQTQWKRAAYNGPLPDSFVSNSKYKDIQIFYNKEL